MNAELKCPHCGKVFKVDESDYASILMQVKNAEFTREVERRLAELKSESDARRKAADAEAARLEGERLAAKDREMAGLRGEIERLKAQITNHDATSNLRLQQSLAEKEKAKNEELARKDREIAELRTTVATGEKDKELACAQVREAMQQLVSNLDKEIVQLRADAEAAASKAKENEESLRKAHRFQLEEKEQQIAQLRDMKARMSTKMIGESLEQHCLNEFNSLRALAFPTAYFEKDNDAGGGSKGDFIFRDYDGDDEYISIMFEMKNEMDTTATKHRNEDFFDKLNRDRVSKKCEYAVLVSLLEADNDLYNQGIVDVSYRYDKMYVIRPQFFIPVISMLSRASKKSMLYKRQLELAQSQSIDVTNFEIKLNKFKTEFGDKLETAHEKYSQALGRIDNAIKSLQTIRTLFEQSERALLQAGNKLDQDFTIKKLTWNNKTMQAKFKEARRGEQGIEE
ncbi:MAG: DUF2130 domain-containing protein [Odoribacter sp.]|nr:DUF2130 domain-containing protein [Odoribacter sp.]